MNHQVILFHLREAKEELDRTIAEIASEPDYGFEEYQVAMSHLYHHLNTAWNGRDQTDEQHKKCTDVDFARFRRFPQDADLLLDI
jgi:hypothetical protein